jgi:membrane-associated protein
MQKLIDIFLHVNEHLERLAADYGPWIYGLLFAVVFCETGLVVTPFLPGDSLLFAVGALVGTGVLEWFVLPLLFVAAVLGNTCNYWIGRKTGPKIFRGESTSVLSRLMSRKHLERANAFFQKHGGKAVMLGQFLPIVRTFVPYVAGAGAMHYPRFIMFNVLGALTWVGVCGGAGYLFGQHPFVRKHFELVVIGIIAVSLLPIVIHAVKSKWGKQAASA